MRHNNIKLNNLNIKNKASSVDLQLSNSNIYIELKYRQLLLNDYNTTLFDKRKVDIWPSSKKLSEASIYIYALALLMVRITLSSIIKNCWIVLIQSIF